MVNLKKWEEISHEDVKLGDELKIVWTKTSDTLKRKEVHKGKVSRTEGNGDFYLNGVGWEDGEPFKGTTTTLYRRKAKEFVFPTAKGAIVAGEGVNDATVELVHRGAGRWLSLNNAGTYSEAFLHGYLKNLRVLSAGF